jgi:hypothetical protein
LQMQTGYGTIDLWVNIVYRLNIEYQLCSGWQSSPSRRQRLQSYFPGPILSAAFIFSRQSVPTAQFASRGSAIFIDVPVETDGPRS